MRLEAAAAIERVDQRVTLTGCCSSVFTITRSTSSSLIERGLQGRGSVLDRPSAAKAQPSRFRPPGGSAPARVGRRESARSDVHANAPDREGGEGRRPRFGLRIPPCRALTEVADCVGSLLEATESLPDNAQLLPRRVVPLRAGLTIPALLAGVALRTVDVELLEWSLGGVRLVSVPGEAFHELGRQIECARDDQALLAGLAPQYHGYLPMPFRRGYEEKMSYGSRFVARLGQALVDVPAMTR